MMYTIAHRGLAEDYPENTLTAIRKSSESCEFVEIDVRETADGEFVVIHDETLQRVFNSEKSVYLNSLSTLQSESSDVNSAPLPTLDEAINAASVPLIIELKGPIDTEAFARVIQSIDHEVLVQSFHPSHFQDISRNCDVRTGLLVPPARLIGETGVPIDSITTPKDAIEFVVESDGDFISFHHRFCTESVIELARQSGLDVFGWTVRDEEVAEKLEANGVDGIITDSLEYLS